MASRGKRNGSPRPYSRFYRPKLLLFLPSSSTVLLTRLSGPRWDREFTIKKKELAIWLKTNFRPTGHHHPRSSPLLSVCTVPRASAILNASWKSCPVRVFSTACDSATITSIVSKWWPFREKWGGGHSLFLVKSPVEKVNLRR
jgi:hypothetical protein